MNIDANKVISKLAIKNAELIRINTILETQIEAMQEEIQKLKETNAEDKG